MPATRTKTKTKTKTKAKTGNKARGIKHAIKPAPTRKRSRPPKIHIREKVAPSSDTLCGGSHSDLWNRHGDRPLESVAPQQAKKATCGRCIRVQAAREAKE